MTTEWLWSRRCVELVWVTWLSVHRWCCVSWCSVGQVNSSNHMISGAITIYHHWVWAVEWGCRGPFKLIIKYKQNYLSTNSNKTTLVLTPLFSICILIQNLSSFLLFLPKGIHRFVPAFRTIISHCWIMVEQFCILALNV